MRLVIEGQHHRADNKDLRKLARWVMKELLSDEERKDLSIRIVLKPVYTADGWCYFDSKKKYRIHINQRMGLKRVAETLVHELVHVKQYVSGELRECGITGDMLWKGKKAASNYWKQPWEIEAFGLQRCLLGLYGDQQVAKRKRKAKGS